MSSFEKDSKPVNFYGPGSLKQGPKQPTPSGQAPKSGITNSKEIPSISEDQAQVKQNAFVEPDSGFQMQETR